MADFVTHVEIKAITKQFDRRMKSVQTQIGGATKKASKFGNVLNGLGQGLAIGATIKKVVGSMRDLEKAQKEVATLGFPAEELEKLNKAGKDFSKQFGTTQIEQQKAFYLAISAGASDAKGAMEILAAGNKLATAGLANVDDATGSLSKSLNAFGLEAKEASRVSDVMFGVVKLGITTIPELSAKFGLAASLASNAGLSIEEYGAAIAEVTKTGLKTSEAISAIKQTLANVLKPSKQASEYAEELGINFNAAALQAKNADGSTKGLVGVLGDVSTAIGELPVEEQTGAFTKLFGSIEGLNAVLALSKDGAKQFKATTAQLMNSAGSTDKAFKIMDETIDARLRKMSTAFSNLSVDVGKGFIPVIEKVVPVLQKLVEGFGNFVSQHPNTVLMATAIGLVGAAIKILGGPITAIVLAIGLGIAAWNDWDKTVNLAKETWSKVKEWFGAIDFSGIFSGFANSVKDFNFEEAGRTVGNLLSEAIKGAFGLIGDFFKTIFTKEGASDTANALWDAFTSILKGLGGFVLGVFKGIDFGGVVSSFAVALKTAVLSVWEGIKIGWNFLSEVNWGDVASSLGNAFVDGIKSAYSSIVSFFSGLLHEITGGYLGTEAVADPAVEAKEIKDQQIEHTSSVIARKEQQLADSQAFLEKANQEKAEGVKRSGHRLRQHNRKLQESGLAVGSLTQEIEKLKVKLQTLQTPTATATTPESKAKGGYTNKYSKGGWAKKVNKYAKGGSVNGPGSGRSDSIPAMLSNGEFVVNAKSTAMYGPLLEELNAKGLRAGGYSSGKSGCYADGGIADAKSYQFLQFDEGGKKGSFDVETTIDRFLKGLDKSEPEVQKLITNLDKLSSKSKDRTQQQTLKLDLAARVNKQLVDLVKINKVQGEVTKGTIGSVRDLGKTAKGLTNEWKGMGKELTGPIKNAFLEGGSIGDGIKAGMHGLLQTVAGKLMDRAFKPLEDMLDNTLNDLFGSGEVTLGATVANPMLTKDVNATGVLTGASPVDSLMGGFEDDDSQFSMLAEQNADFFDQGQVTQQTMLMEQMEGFGDVTTSIFDQTGSMSGMFDGLGGLFSQGLEGLGGFLSNMGGGSSGGGFDVMGLVSSIFMAKGGIVPKPGQQPLYFGAGGFVPKGTDTVPAMLTPGEMVLNKDQQDMLGGGSNSTTYNTYNLEVTGNVDERAINQIRNIIQNSPNQVNQASQRGERERTGLRPSNRR